MIEHRPNVQGGTTVLNMRIKRIIGMTVPTEDGTFRAVQIHGHNQVRELGFFPTNEMAVNAIPVK